MNAIRSPPSATRPPPSSSPMTPAPARTWPPSAATGSSLFFYPKDFTPGCTTEVCEFRDLDADFAAAGATVWSVSVLDADSKARFKAKHGLTFPLLADAHHAVAERYGVWVEKQHQGKTYMGIQRATFLIDPAGRVARVWPKVRVEGHAAEVLEACAAQRGAS